LKEILRTLVIFAVIEIAVIAFAKWYFSRYVWLLTWLFSFLLVPFFRIGTKYLLDKSGFWLRDTWIIGSGKNANEAYKAINSEKNLGLHVVGFITTSVDGNECLSLTNVKNLDVSPEWLETIDKRTQFIVAVEANEGETRNRWLREFMIKGFRYVSVIPTLRGVPLDSTDMSFIFSHEVMIFRVQQNLAKLSSRILKRAFDIIGSLSIII
ncbi:TPA: UDP-phosphate galactose phosphotransferase, partial [Klebsiella pneumoniae]|nr:UDP-phosphate galactose phosphotransferase [Klebsiella pneumoniae]